MMSMMKKKSLLILFFCFVSFFIGNEIYADAIPEGTTIYYDDTITNWGTISMYFLKEDGTNSNWYDDSMVMKAEGNGIFSYTLEYNSSQYDWMIFRKKEGANPQTQDLKYIRPNYIFKSENVYGNKYIGNWYVKDSSEIIEKKNNFNILKKEWYTNISYNALEEIIKDIPTITSDYLKSYWDYTEQRHISSYEIDLEKLNNAYANLEFSPEKLNTKIDEFETKDTEGYTFASINKFRDDIDDVKKYISDGAYTLEGLEDNYNKLNIAYDSLEIATKDEENELIEALKREINKLKEILNSNNNDVQEVLIIYSDIEDLYKRLTKQNSNLLEIVGKVLEENSKDNSIDNKNVIAYITEEMEKLNGLLNSDGINIEDLINQYKEMEEKYKELQKNNSNMDNNKRVENLILELDKKNNRLIYIIISIIVLVGILMTILLLKRK